jgi:hypothetical protein
LEYERFYNSRNSRNFPTGELFNEGQWIFECEHHRFAVDYADYADFLSSGTLSLWLSCKKNPYNPHNPCSKKREYLWLRIEWMKENEDINCFYPNI